MRYAITAEYVDDKHGQPLAVLDGFPGLGAELRSDEIENLILDLGAILAKLRKRERATPEYIRREEAKRQSRIRAYEAALARPGFILVYFGFDQPYGCIRPRFHVAWLPETGPRWLHTGYRPGYIDVEAMKTIQPYKNHYGRKAGLEIAKLVGEESKRLGYDYSLVAVHLLDEGPDRRAAYRARKSLDHTACSTGGALHHTA